ncbi:MULTISPECIES: MarR family winged helix-turn-helix transcriptional regulator [unclassified Rathayibacter]|jgi:DNA-binding MarR family transcriptional regulator|uniref:MarR family winged helix-turn-helix transcriptional regulator n=1 Tax=unclassified Rathayibacter TaxID=2609250 RepID=UPI000FAFBBF8|nr:MULTISPECIES: MarR family winged helix-turn-helix transcriptional regulator [unclassified Rathayibacter]ROP45136.1 DNA-binding MarR family transcriptional regulator [Rathayibacter sp. PhB186]ROS47827.1 DNA-binding MarR family transcriptional regulator [Rathayibacter sp. PhB185]
MTGPSSPPDPETGGHAEGDRATEGATDAAIAAVEGELSTLFNRVRDAMRSAAERLHPDLSTAGYRTLATLERRGPMHSGALAELLETDKSSISRQISALDRLGLLQRSPDPDDGRATILSVPPETAERMRAIRSSRQALMHEELRRWEAGDVELFAVLLRRITALDMRGATTEPSPGQSGAGAAPTA